MKRLGLLITVIVLLALVVVPVSNAQLDWIAAATRAFGMERGFNASGDPIANFTRGLQINGSNLTTAEFTALDGITAGTAAASKAVILDANKAISGLGVTTIKGADAGGLLYLNTADSTAVTAASGDASTNETAYDLSFTAPADTFVAGDTCSIRGYVSITDSDATAAGTIRLRIKFGGQTVVDSTALTMDNDVGGAGDASERIYFDVQLGLRTATTGYANTMFGHDVGNGLTTSSFFSGLSVSSLDLTSTQAITVTVQYGTEDSDNSSTLTSLAIERN